MPFKIKNHLLLSLPFIFSCLIFNSSANSDNDVTFIAKQSVKQGSSSGHTFSTKKVQKLFFDHLKQDKNADQQIEILRGLSDKVDKKIEKGFFRLLMTKQQTEKIKKAGNELRANLDEMSALRTEEEKQDMLNDLYENILNVEKKEENGKLAPVPLIDVRHQAGQAGSWRKEVIPQQMDLEKMSDAQLDYLYVEEHGNILADEEGPLLPYAPSKDEIKMAHIILISSYIQFAIVVAAGITATTLLIAIILALAV